MIKESIFQSDFSTTMYAGGNLMALPTWGCFGISSGVFTKEADGSLFGFPSRHSQAHCTSDRQNKLDAGREVWNENGLEWGMRANVTLSYLQNICALQRAFCILFKQLTKLKWYFPRMKCAIGLVYLGNGKCPLNINLSKPLFVNISQDIFGQT